MSVLVTFGMFLGLRCQARDERAWGGVRGTVGVLNGSAYYEATVADEGLCRVGWSTKSATLDVGSSVGSFGYGGTGKKSTARQFEDYGQPFGQVGEGLVINHWNDL